MPIDPSIALGVRPVEMPNVLGQFGQMVAIKAAQQEMEGNEGSRNALAKGMEPTDPRILQYGKSGRETFKAAGEGRIKQLEAASKSNLLLGSIFGGVLQDPTTGPQAVARLKDMGLLTEAQAQKVIVEAGNNPDVWRRIAKPYYDGAISAEKRLAEETSIENNKRTVGASYYGSNVSRDNSIRADKREREKLQIVTGNDGFYTISPFDPNSARPVGMTPPPPPARPPVTNALVNPATASTIVNAPTNSLLPTVQSQPGAPTVANAPTNILRPAKPIRQPVAVMENGKAILVTPDKAVGMQPATAFTEKQAYGKAETVRNLNTAIANLSDVIKPGGLLEQSTGSGFGRAFDASAAFFGQATEGAKAAASLAPIADLVLKMVPRFEGPQSDKDTQSYKEAAGQLANSGLPNETRRDAAKVIIRLMTERRDQFGMTDQVGGGSATTTTPIYATNGKDRIMSTDGGNTWTPAGAK